MKPTTILRLLVFPALVSVVLSSQELEVPPPPTLPANSVQDARKAGWSDPADIQYWRALSHQGTAHSLIIVSVIDPKTDKPRAFCLYSGSFLRALRAEFKLGDSEEARTKAIQIAVSMRDQPIRFTDRKALSTFLNVYSQQDLNRAISRISKFTNRELISGFSSYSDPSFEDTLVGINRRASRRSKWALAHAIYLRGLSVGEGCMSNSLWVSE